MTFAHGGTFGRFAARGNRATLRPICDPAGVPDPPEPDAPPPRRTLRRSSRLTGKNAFGPVFAAKLRRDAGPLTVRVAPNGLGFHRLGVSVPKRVGNAVVRHRWKRLVREAFRLHRAAWPGAYDLVVVVQPSRKPATSAGVARLLDEVVPRLHADAQRRAAAGKA